MAWQELPIAIVDKVFGKVDYNKILDCIYALKVLIEKEHNWSNGIHNYPTMGRKGATAWCAFQGNGTGTPTIQAGESFRAESIARLLTGVYQVTWADNIGDTILSANLYLPNTGTAVAYASYGEINSQTQSSIHIIDSAGAYVDLSTSYYGILIAWG